MGLNFDENIGFNPATCLNICNTVCHVCSPLPYNISSNICMWSNAMGVSRNSRLFLSPLKLLLFPLLLDISYFTLIVNLPINGNLPIEAKGIPNIG